MKNQPTLCIVGLGYVGLPLAHAFARIGFTVYGYDIGTKRIEELQKGKDSTNELTEDQLREVTIEYTTDPAVIGKATVIILAIPTPVDEDNRPDLTLLKSAAATVGKYLQKGSIVVSESTVYPGVTEDILGPILAEESGLLCGEHFKLGYSPERVNPGDKEHTIEKITKVVAGQDTETTDYLVKLYGKVISEGIHRASSIKVAEMSKAIENAQRDLNIAYINEIAMMCNKIGIPTKDVLEAAKTKWSFIPFDPGLVGGHCIGVDPYYLVEKAREMDMPTHVITAGRKINDSMAKYIAGQVLAALRESGTAAKEAYVLVMGLTFKENIPDTRNAKAQDVVHHLQEAGCTVFTHDPYVDNNDALKKSKAYDAILLLVPHMEYQNIPSEDLMQLGKDECVIYDLKSLYAAQDFEEAGMTYLAL